jgi:hypothetical protein
MPQRASLSVTCLVDQLYPKAGLAMVDGICCAGADLAEVLASR